MRWLIIALLLATPAYAANPNTYPYVYLFDLSATLSAVSPKVGGVSVGDPADKQTWTVDWSSEPTAQEEADVAAAIAAYDPAKLVPPQPTVDKLVKVLIDKHVITPSDMK